MTEREWCRQLKTSSRLQSDADITKYREASAALTNGSDPVVLSEILDALNDVDAGEVQYELIEACESFPDDIYVPTILDKMEVLTKRSPFWSELMLTSLLNAKKTRELLIQYLKSLSGDRIHRFQDHVDSLIKKKALS